MKYGIKYQKLFNKWQIQTIKNNDIGINTNNHDLFLQNFINLCSNELSFLYSDLCTTVIVFMFIFFRCVTQPYLSVNYLYTLVGLLDIHCQLEW